MTELITFETPRLTKPVMIMGFSGTFDMALVSTTTISHLANRTLASEIAMLDPEYLYNFSRVRPLTRMDSSGSLVIDWPGIDLKMATFSERDLLLLAGEEPQYRWRTSAEKMAELAANLGCELAISLGAVNGMVPHTRDFPVYGYTTDDTLAEEHDLDQPEYEGPTGYMAALNTELEYQGIPSISIRVEVPHYLPTPPSPKGVRALLQYVQEITGIETHSEDLDSEVEDWEYLVDKAVGMDDENSAYVAQLEQQFDSEEEMVEAGEDLVIELESFLAEEADEDEDEA